ncbi:MAG: hypothetical protein OXE84_09160 [Rhodobacteraceae bacterium]|nr:hypothetical protein [Paracoccaceae bacterium]MCY4196694.1 hypothetical protein [Paracoccaceae bacterium]
MSGLQTTVLQTLRGGGAMCVWLGRCRPATHIWRGRLADMRDLTRLFREDPHLADDLLTEVRDDENLYDDVVALRVSLDGTMLRMHAEELDGQAYEHGWREADCGVVAQLDSTGEGLYT